MEASSRIRTSGYVIDAGGTPVAEHGGAQAVDAGDDVEHDLPASWRLLGGVHPALAGKEELPKGGSSIIDVGWGDNHDGDEHHRGAFALVAERPQAQMSGVTPRSAAGSGTSTPWV
ncbi:MAG: hypothetical protein ACYC1D_07865 [Acidimicrobiales bacterium]